MPLILPNSRDIGNKFLFGHFMMRPDYGCGRKMEGPCYGRVHCWCSDNHASYDVKLQNEMDYMEKVGCNGYIIELCANRFSSEKYSQAWVNELERKYNKFLELIKKHKKMWALVCMFNDNAWQMGGGPSNEIANKIIDVVKKAGHSDMVCLVPVAEPESETGKNMIHTVHSKLSGFKFLKSSHGDDSQNYWNWYSTGEWEVSSKKLFQSSDSGERIAYLAGYEDSSYPWVPEFNIEELESYDYRGDLKRTVQWVRSCISVRNTVTAAYYAFDYDGNNDGTEGDEEGHKDSHCKNGIDVYAICAEVVGCDKKIPIGQMEDKANALVTTNGGEKRLY